MCLLSRSSCRLKQLLSLVLFFFYLHWAWSSPQQCCYSRRSSPDFPIYVHVRDNSLAHTYQKFLQCFSLFDPNPDIARVIYTQNNSSYSSILQSRLPNLRFNTTQTPKPLLIVTPLIPSHVQAAVICSRKHRLQLRIRSGGHDSEGLSYTSFLPVPFLLLDLFNFRNITIGAEKGTAWVQSGASTGELYYRIAEKSRTLAFPAGICPTIGVGGHLSGGGYGFLMRKYGLAVDTVIDAYLVDADSRILDRASMGEDLFWAIRSGGGNSFGVVISWKVNLVPVPSTVTVFKVPKTFTPRTIQIIHRWQYVASKLPDDLSLFIMLSGSSQQGNLTRVAEFQSLFLGRAEELLELMEERFPELGLKRKDCIEMSWIESIVFFSIPYPSNSSLDVLLDRSSNLASTKSKSDYVKKPMSKTAIKGLLERYSDVGIESPRLAMVPYGGIMDEIPESSIPFPHRAGNLYLLGYLALWRQEGVEAERRHIEWIRKVYDYMTPYVSKNPREAYANYRDLDIGTNNLTGNRTSYRRASIWGTKYYRNNFKRLVCVKTAVDPLNVFRNEQSIPPLSSY